MYIYNAIIMTLSPGEELCQLQKALNEFTFEVTQLQAQLDSVHREKSVLQSKQIEMERMHIQMKEAMSADISYLRKLNLQLVEQHMKGNYLIPVVYWQVCDLAPCSSLHLLTRQWVWLLGLLN